MVTKVWVVARRRRGRKKFYALRWWEPMATQSEFKVPYCVPRGVWASRRNIKAAERFLLGSLELDWWRIRESNP